MQLLTRTPRNTIVIIDRTARELYSAAVEQKVIDEPTDWRKLTPDEREYWRRRALARIAGEERLA